MDKQEISFVLGKRLKELREERGLSHVDLIKQLNERYGVAVSRDSVMAYEISDETRAKASKLPNMGMRVEYLYCLADFYGVSLDYLLGRTDEKTIDIDVRSICEKTGLSKESVEILSEPKNNHDFLLLLINNLICESYSYQPAARFAARYWIQAEVASDAKSSEESWLEKTLCFMHQENTLRNDDHISSIVEITASDAGDFYRDRAIREIENISLQSIKAYKGILKPQIEEVQNLPDDLKEKLNFIQRIHLLAANATLKDVLGNEFKGIPELNDLEAELNGIRTNVQEKPVKNMDN